MASRRLSRNKGDAQVKYNPTLYSFGGQMLHTSGSYRGAESDNHASFASSKLGFIMENIRKCNRRIERKTFTLEGEVPTQEGFGSGVPSADHIGRQSQKNLLSSHKVSPVLQRSTHQVNASTSWIPPIRPPTTAVDVIILKTDSSYLTPLKTRGGPNVTPPVSEFRRKDMRNLPFWHTDLKKQSPKLGKTKIRAKKGEL